MKLYIKNMGGSDNYMKVKAILEDMDVKYNTFQSGEVDLKYPLSTQEMSELKDKLAAESFELINDKKNILVEKIKEVIITMINQEDTLPKMKNSIYISEKMNYSYTYLANIFSAVTGMSIENFIIERKIDRAKELITHNHMNLSEIARELRYSSVAHLSSQFKKITGLTPSFYKINNRKNRFFSKDKLAIS